MRRTLGVLLVSLLAVTALAACGDDDDDGDTSADATTTTEAAASGNVTVRAGVNDPKDPNIAVLQFLPAEVKVAVGEELDWVWTGAEPHTVTFQPAGTERPTPDKGAALPVAKPTGPYDGTTTINTGLLLKGGGQDPEPLELTFAKAGSYEYFCAIHPQMTGEVTVVDAGGDTDSAADVTDRGDTELAKWLEEGRAAKQKLTEAEPASTKNADGSTTWTVQMGTTTEHTDVLAFAPTPATAKAGDSVTFVNGSGAPHTATFNAPPNLLTNPEGEASMTAAPGPSPQALADAKTFLNTGWLPPDAPPGQGPPLPARSYTVKLPNAGDYAYVCILHALSGMTGTIRVS